tara:strand:+ start:1658 stop:2542 length:885 start_codon:yes stop_codon:yes gene_type:complete
MGLITQTGQQYYQTASPTPFGNYQFTSLETIINQFIIAYVGEDKIISKIRRTDISFHAKRALQELSFDTFKSIKSQEITLPSSLTMILPQDYVNYVKLTFSDQNGTEKIIYPAIKTSNPTDVGQDANGDYTFTAGALDTDSSSDTWDKYKAINPNPDLSGDDAADDEIYAALHGQRYGLDPQNSQSNGSFYIDENTGLIHFSSGLSGKTIILKYISDSLGTDAEMKVHKFAEEAMYKHIAYAILSTRANTQEYLVQRFKKEKFAETRKAKLRLSNIKLEEITQILRGKSKQIKH